MAQWDQLTSYPAIVRKTSPRITQMLDTLEELQPPDLTKNRYSALADFLDQGVAAGLITLGEMLDARSVIGPEM